MVEKLRITKCAICEQEHIYDVKISRTLVTNLFSGRKKSKEVKNLLVSRILKCPTEDKVYKVELNLPYTSDQHIDSVEITISEEE